MRIAVRYPFRVKVGALAVVVCSLLSTGLAVRRALDGIPTSPDEVTRSEVRFQRLKAALAPAGVVGYLSDPKRSEVTSDDEYGKRLFLAQYALAPIIVVDSVDPGLVVANFLDDSPRRQPIPAGFVIVEDFGMGLILLRRGRE